MASLEKRHGTGWALTSPYIIYALVFFAIPVVWSIILMFTEWNLISPEREFVGLRNFLDAIQSPRVLNAFLVTYKFLIIFVPVVIALSVTLAVIIHSIPRFKQFFAVGYFTTYLASGVAVSHVVNGIIGYQSPLNQFLRNTTGSSPDWLGDPWMATFVIAAMLVWKFSGYYTLIFLAGLQGIPKIFYEDAELAGAGAWQRFVHITFPLLYPSFFTVLVLASGITFTIFTEPFVLTGGGPQMATQTWQLEIYYQAFERYRAGYGATVALFNAVVTFASIAIIRAGARAWGRRVGFEEEG
jgi:multiple sugar transport system permease protein